METLMTGWIVAPMLGTVSACLGLITIAVVSHWAISPKLTRIIGNAVLAASLLDILAWALGWGPHLRDPHSVYNIFVLAIGLLTAIGVLHTATVTRRAMRRVRR